MAGEPYAGLKELDIILFRPSDWVGRSIVWSQWGMDVHSPEFCHVAVALKQFDRGELEVFQTNPPGPSFRAIESIDWPNVAVLSFQGMQPMDAQMTSARTWARAQLGRFYGYPSIGGFLFLGLLGRLARRWARQERSRPNPIAEKSMQVCSQIVDSLFMDVLKMDILPDIATGQAVPGDLITSVLHRHVFGRLGES